MVKWNLSVAPWRWMVAVGAVLAAVIFVYPMTLGIPLLDPDEGLHASIAQEMVERGDWVIPHFLATPFLDKPIFYFWAEALSLRLFGMHEAAVRFPGLMFGLLGAVTTGIVALRMFGAGVGLVAGLFYATTILPAALAQAATHDVALIPWINLALLLFWESDRAATRRVVGGDSVGDGELPGLVADGVASHNNGVASHNNGVAAHKNAALGYTLAIGLLLGLTCLTKGLVGVALVGVAYGGYLLLTRRLTLAACLRGSGALAVAAVVASFWYVAVELRNPGYLYYYFVERHLLGYATGTQIHGNAPWWYYLPILLGGGLPWIAYLPATVRDDWQRRKSTAGYVVGGDSVGGGELPGLVADGVASHNNHGATVLLWCWLLGGTLFLSTSHSKLVTYIWPVFPAVAILAAVAWVRLIEGALCAEARRLILLTFLLTCLTGMVILPGAMLVVQSEFALRFSPPVWTVTVLVAAGSWMSLAPLYAGRFRAALGCGMLSMAAQYAVIMTVVLPQVAAATSARELAGHFNRLGRLPPRLLLAEDRIGSLVFYLEPELRAGLREGQLQAVALEGLKEFPQSEPGAMVALPERRAGRAARYLDLSGIDYRLVGRYRLYDATELQTRLRVADGGRIRR